MLTYNKLRESPNEFFAVTGLTIGEFENLLPIFAHKYAEILASGLTNTGKTRQRKSGGGAKARLRTDEDKLFFILVYQKNYPLEILQGHQFGLSQSQVSYWIHRLLPILRESLAETGIIHQRKD